MKFVIGVVCAAVLISVGYYAGVSHGRDSRDLASRLEGHMNYLVQVAQCQ